MTVERTQQQRKDRRIAVQRQVTELTKRFADRWNDAPDLCMAVTRESNGAFGWRAGRDALVRAIASVDQDLVHMTPEEFRAWWAKQSHFLNYKKSMASKVIRDIGIHPANAHLILKGEAKVSRAQALACAWYALDLKLPVDPQDQPAIRQWMLRRFGTMSPVSLYLGYSREILSIWALGYKMVNGKRAERPVPLTGLCAMAWVDRMGAVNPYGQAPRYLSFPTQSEA